MVVSRRPTAASQTLAEGDTDAIPIGRTHATIVALTACNKILPKPRIPAQHDEHARPALRVNDPSHTVTSVAGIGKHALFRARGGSPGRANAYLSLAQYRAILAVQEVRHGATRPSVAGAAAGASVVVLKQFYPLDAAAIDAELEAQRAEPTLGSAHGTDFAAGEIIGRSVAAAVLVLAATDNNGLTSPGVPPVGPGYWISSGAPIVRGGFGATPFFLTSGSELRLPPPPTFGSRRFRRARRSAHARRQSNGATGNQPEVVPFPHHLQRNRDGSHREYHRSERDAARSRLCKHGRWGRPHRVLDQVRLWFVRPTQAVRASHSRLAA